MVRLYLKSLLELVIRALLVFGLVYLLWPGFFWPGSFERHSPTLFLLVVLFFGWLLPATKHVLATRSIQGPERWRVRQRIEVLVEAPLATALERCAAAAGRIPGVKRVQQRGEEAIEARTARWQGERICCRVIATDECQTRMLVSSRPAWPLATTDDGLNWKHVVTIRDALVSGPPTGRRRSREGPGPRARSHQRPLRPPVTARATPGSAAPPAR